MIRDPVDIREEYKRGSLSEKREIWSRLLEKVAKNPTPSSIASLSTLLGIRDEKSNIEFAFRKLREIVKDKNRDTLMRKIGIGSLKANAYKENSLKGNLETFDTLYTILSNDREKLELRKLAGDAIIKLGSKWLTRESVGPQELLEWLEEKRREVGRIEPRNEDLEDAIKRWENLLQEAKEEKLLASILLSLMDKYSLLNARRLLGILRERRLPKDEIIAKWYEIAIERTERISKKGWTEEDIKDIASETSPEELSKAETISRELSEPIKETFSQRFSEKGYKHKD